MNAATVPYPPGPDPESLSLRLTAVPRYVKVQESLLLGGQLLFLAIYLAVIAGCTFAAVWMALNISEGDTFVVITFALGIAICLGIIAFLVRGLFRHPAVALPTPALEVTAEEQPAFFAFLQRVCDDAGAAMPRRVFFAADVNAAVVPRVSLANLVKAPRHDLYVGLGLINAVNLSEFQAVLAHEFGHVAERGPVSDWARGVEGTVERFFTGSRLLQLLHRALTATKVQLIREREFHADRIAASVAGSSAAIHALLKVQFGSETWSHAVADLQRAAELKHYSADLYFHQHAAVETLRRKAKDPRRGLPPRGDEPAFDPAFDEPGGHHPGHSEREINLKAAAIPAPADERTPWLLIRDANVIRRMVTALLLRSWPWVPANASLAEPRAVQNLLEVERADVTHDEKYQGAYDDRDLRLQSQELTDLLAIVRTETWSTDRLQRVIAQLYQDIPVRISRRNAVVNLRQRHLDRDHHADGRHALDRLRDLDERLDKLDVWFQAFDRRAALVHWQMAAQLGEERFQDLWERYRFHLAIQDIATAMKRHSDLVRLHSRVVNLQDRRLDPYLFGELVATLRAARTILNRQLTAARALDMPAMKHFAEADRLAEHLLDEPPLRDLPPAPVREEWIRKLRRQLDRVHSRAARLQAKSLAAILKLQEQTATEYMNLVLLEPTRIVRDAPPPETQQAVDSTPISVEAPQVSRYMELEETFAPLAVECAPIPSESPVDWRQRELEAELAELCKNDLRLMERLVQREEARRPDQPRSELVALALENFHRDLK